ncbi:MAG: carboxypeptidase-like regulatory domain-containing protein [Muribaculaceae bacterium]|nr:carboxypeptidase-like regulatory domain-containing protein [Muribaculaceae bacterium]
MLVAGIPTIAQTRSLSARIISSADSIPVEFATVKLMKDDSALVSATLTDENGVFRFDTPITSGMHLAISSVGCKNLNVPLPCDSVIYLDSSNVLSEVIGRGFKSENKYGGVNLHPYGSSEKCGPKRGVASFNDVNTSDKRRSRQSGGADRPRPEYLDIHRLCSCHNRRLVGHENAGCEES